MKTIKDSYSYILAMIIVVAFFWLLVLLVRKEVPEGNNDILNITVGALIGAYSTVVGYFFGSSKGSADKNELITNVKKDVLDNTDKKE